MSAIRLYWSQGVVGILSACAISVLVGQRVHERELLYWKARNPDLEKHIDGSKYHEVFRYNISVLLLKYENMIRLCILLLLLATEAICENEG